MPDALSRIADILNGMDTHCAFDGYGRMTSIAHRDGANVRQGWTYDQTATITWPRFAAMFPKIEDGSK